jgi:hypothetical protein
MPVFNDPNREFCRRGKASAQGAQSALLQLGASGFYCAEALVENPGGKEWQQRLHGFSCAKTEKEVEDMMSLFSTLQKPAATP